MFTSQMKLPSILQLFLLTMLGGILRAEPPPYLTLVESTPKVIDGLEFSLITQAEWIAPVIILQLRITNRGSASMVFNTLDSYGPIISAADGRNVPLTGIKSRTHDPLVPPNILIAPGSSISLPFDTFFLNRSSRNDHILELQDGMGTRKEAKLVDGEYAVSFWVNHSASDDKDSSTLPAPFWSGKGATEVIHLKLHNTEDSDEQKHKNKPSGASQSATSPKDKASVKVPPPTQKSKAPSSQ